MQNNNKNNKNNKNNADKKIIICGNPIDNNKFDIFRPHDIDLYNLTKLINYQESDSENRTESNSESDLESDNPVFSLDHINDQIRYMNKNNNIENNKDIVDKLDIDSNVENREFDENGEYVYNSNTLFSTYEIDKILEYVKNLILYSEYYLDHKDNKIEIGRAHV